MTLIQAAKIIKNLEKSGNGLLETKKVLKLHDSWRCVKSFGQYEEQLKKNFARAPRGPILPYNYNNMYE